MKPTFPSVPQITYSGVFLLLFTLGRLRWKVIHSFAIRRRVHTLFFSIFKVFSKVYASLSSYSYFQCIPLFWRDRPLRWLADKERVRTVSFPNFRCFHKPHFIGGKLNTVQKRREGAGQMEKRTGRVITKCTWGLEIETRESRFWTDQSDRTQCIIHTGGEEGMGWKRADGELENGLRASNPWRKSRNSRGTMRVWISTIEDYTWTLYIGWGIRKSPMVAAWTACASAGRSRPGHAGTLGALLAFRQLLSARPRFSVLRGLREPRNKEIENL